VGKSTAAAALALAWSANRSVHLLSTDPARSLSDVLGLHMPAGVPSAACTPSLLAEELDAEARSSAWQERAKAPLVELLQAGSYLSDQDIGLITGLRLPGTGEIMAALRLVELADEGAHTVVVDIAPTGHTLRLLDAHLVLGSWAGMLAALAARGQAVARVLTGSVVPRATDEYLAALEARIARFRERVLGTAAFLVATRSGELEAAETDRLVLELRVRRKWWCWLHRATLPSCPCSWPPRCWCRGSGSGSCASCWIVAPLRPNAWASPSI
jgi:arsenite-transporting ATPase